MLELYAAYYDIIVMPLESLTPGILSGSIKKTSAERRINLVAPDTKLILVTTRAFIAMGDIKGALELLQATSRSALDFNMESKVGYYCCC